MYYALLLYKHCCRLNNSFVPSVMHDASWALTSDVMYPADYIIMISPAPTENRHCGIVEYQVDQSISKIRVCVSFGRWHFALVYTEGIVVSGHGKFSSFSWDFITISMLLITHKWVTRTGAKCILFAHFNF